MVHLIDKDPLVAEIERRIKFQQTCIKTAYRLTGKAEEEIILEYNQLLSFLDTLEVKEVDLDKEIKKVQRSYKTIDEYDGYPCTMYARGIELIAKHFFELGLRVNNEKEK